MTPPLERKYEQTSMTDCGPPAMLDGPLSVVTLSVQMYVCFLSTSKVNLIFASLMRTQWPIFIKLGMFFMKFVWALGTCKYFQAFPVVLKKICLTVSKCFHVSTHKSFAYYQLHRNKRKFLDYISESVLEKE